VVGDAEKEMNRAVDTVPAAAHEQRRQRPPMQAARTKQ
jgi:hypothetical protein